MQFSKKILVVFGSGLCALAGAASVTAAENAGWYVGFSAGQSTTDDIDQDELDFVVEEAFWDAGYPVISGSSTLDDKGTSWSIFAGYRFNPYFAVEGGYLKLGDIQYRSSGLVDPPGAATSAPASFDFDYESKGLTLAAVGSVPLGQAFDVHGRLGVFFADTELTATANISGGIGTDSVSASTQETFVGIGVGFKFTERLGLNLDWTRYGNVGDEEETGEANVDDLSLSLVFRF